MGSAASSSKLTESIIAIDQKANESVIQPVQKENESVIIQSIQKKANESTVIQSTKKVIIKLPNDSVYIGEYSNGKLTLLNGDVFEGQLDDNDCATGKMLCGKNNTYDGKWKDHFRYGMGKKITYSRKSVV